MTIPRATALVVASTILLSAGVIAHSIVAPREARADVAGKQFKVTMANGASRTGPLSMNVLACTSNKGAVLCQVTLFSPAGPMVLPGAGPGRQQSAGMIGCALLTHSVAEGRALVAQLTDPNMASTVACGDTTGTPGAPGALVVLQIDTTNVQATQSFSF